MRSTLKVKSGFTPTPKILVRGFTLIEIIVSAIIMATTIAGIFTVFTSGNKFVQRSNRRLIAINLAQEQLENRRVLVSADTWNNGGANDLGITPPAITKGWSGPVNLIATPILFEYRYRVDVDQQPDHPSNIDDVAACRRVYMQVRFPEI